jgi:hypothetical protein
MYKKVIIAVDCENEQEQQMVQTIAKELSELLHLKAKDLIEFYPILKTHRALIYNSINIISKEGKRGLLKLVPMLMKQL